MSIINAQAFKIIEGRPVTSSRIVAEYFGKRHNDVLRGIRDLIEKNTDLSKSFIAREEQIETSNGASRSNPVFLMDQKGFCILAMGFTGAKALEFKCAFYHDHARRTARHPARSGHPCTQDRVKLSDDLPRHQGTLPDRTLRPTASHSARRLPRLHQRG